MIKPRATTSNKTTIIFRMVAISALLVVAGCSGPGTEDALVDGTPPTIPGTETAPGVTETSQTQVPGTGPSITAPVQAPGAPTNPGTPAPPVQRAAPPLPPTGSEDPGFDGDQLTAPPVSGAGLVSEPAPPRS